VDNDGRILAWYNDVKKRYYDEDEDSDDPYKTKKMAHDIERKRRRHLLGTRLKKKVKVAVEIAKKKQRLTGKKYVVLNLACQIDFAVVATEEEDRKPAGEKKERNC
jgi:hypothetical protein